MEETPDARPQTTARHISSGVQPALNLSKCLLSTIPLFLLLVSCGSAPNTPTATATLLSAETATAPSSTNTPSPVQIVESEATQAPPPTPTSQSTTQPIENQSTDQATNLSPTVFTDYRDDLLGITLQRPVDWTPQFPIRSEITSFFDDAQLQANPSQSYAVFRYEAVGRLEDNSSPDMIALLLPYLQQNVSADLTLDALEATTLNGLPAAQWQEQTSFTDGIELIAREWLVYAEPLLYRLSTTAQVAPEGVDYRPDLQRMLDSLKFEQPSLLRGVLQFGRYEPYLADNTFYSSNNHGIALRHPADAILEDTSDHLIVASHERLLDGFDENEVGYLILYQELEQTDAQPDITLADQLIKLPETTSRQVDRADVLIERYNADAIMYRNRPDNRFTYEVTVYIIDKGGSQAAIVGVKFGTAAPAIWTEEVIGSLIFGP